MEMEKKDDSCKKALVDNWKWIKYSIVAQGLMYAVASFLGATMSKDYIANHAFNVMMSKQNWTQAQANSYENN